MTLLRRIGGFLRAPAARKSLVLEAGWELLRARLMTLRSARSYSPDLGTLVKEDAAVTASGDQTDPPAAEIAGEIGHVVSLVADTLPFRAECLQRAIAVRRMLRRRGIPAMVYLGIARDRVERTRVELGQAAHAWVAVGSRVVSGDGVLEKYAIVARFA